MAAGLIRVRSEYSGTCSKALIVPRERSLVGTGTGEKEDTQEVVREGLSVWETDEKLMEHMGPCGPLMIYGEKISSLEMHFSRVL